MRKAPTILAVVFIVITLARVAEFSANRMQAGLLGWLFSMGLGAGVYLSAYFTREHVASRETEKGEKIDRRSKTVQDWAWGALLFFVVIDGLFNIAEVWSAVDPQDILMKVATGAYGAFPTLAAALLGALQGHVDRLPKPPAQANANIALSLRKTIVSRLEAYAGGSQDRVSVSQDNQPVLELAPIEKQVAQALAFHCPSCARSYASQQALAAHMRKHLRERQGGKEDHAQS